MVEKGVWTSQHPPTQSAQPSLTGSCACLRLWKCSHGREDVPAFRRSDGDLGDLGGSNFFPTRSRILIHSGLCWAVALLGGTASIASIGSGKSVGAIFLTMASIEEHRETLKKLGWTDELIDAFVKAEGGLPEMHIYPKVDVVEPETEVIESDDIVLATGATRVPGTILYGGRRMSNLVIGGPQRSNPHQRYT